MQTSRDKSSSRAFELRLHLNEEIDMKKFSGIRDRSLTIEKEPEIIDRFTRGFPDLSFCIDEKKEVRELGTPADRRELVRNTIEEMTKRYGSRFTNLQMRLNAFKTTPTREV